VRVAKKFTYSDLFLTDFNLFVNVISVGIELLKALLEFFDKLGELINLFLYTCMKVNKLPLVPANDYQKHGTRSLTCSGTVILIDLVLNISELSHNDNAFTLTLLTEMTNIWK
jgi:hypothetical protein